jgi:hypothetical protein
MPAASRLCQRINGPHNAAKCGDESHESASLGRDRQFGKKQTRRLAGS